ncbi:MAG: DUF5813 family protein, partial [Halodesulfurarchaeum sp.]
PAESDVYEVTDLTFRAWVRPGPEPVLVAEVPTLDAVVEGETVAPVVEEGWFETLDRRLTDAPGVVDGRAEAPTVTRSGETIRIEVPMTAEGTQAPEDAVALATYIEGTWVEGIIPGYEYEDRIQSIRERAREAGGDGGARER